MSVNRADLKKLGDRGGSWVRDHLTEDDRERLTALAMAAGASDAGAAHLVEAARLAVHLYVDDSEPRPGDARRTFSAIQKAADKFLATLIDSQPEIQEALRAAIVSRTWRIDGYVQTDRLREIAESVLLVREAAIDAAPIPVRGAPPRRDAQQLVATLADAWHTNIGKPPAYSRGSHFYRYARTVLEIVGYVSSESGQSEPSVEALIKNTV